MNRQLLESAGEGILRVDPSVNTTFANPAALAMTSHSLGAMLRCSQHPLLHPTRSDGQVYPRRRNA
ncbi:PAS domain-containing protein [Deinococcus sp. SDU3-2]|uniref:PAS domain-containing protein n=1 Tax=Deinococcus terrestris TaxID=2651870 RepID=A0A7X1NXE9_9DEIO|nr:PAS domain-containing protein [Deinococcus terrestris]